VVELDGRRTSTVYKPADFFGERALLRRCARGATVRAAGALRVLRLDRADFDAARPPPPLPPAPPRTMTVRAQRGVEMVIELTRRPLARTKCAPSDAISSHGSRIADLFQLQPKVDAPRGFQHSAKVSDSLTWLSERTPHAIATCAEG